MHTKTPIISEKYFTDSKRDISFYDGESKNPNDVKCK